MIGAILVRCKAERVRAFHHDTHVGGAIPYRLNDIRAPALSQKDLYIRVELRESSEILGNILKQRRSIYVDMDDALHPLRIVEQLYTQLFQLLKNPLHVE